VHAEREREREKVILSKSLRELIVMTTNPTGTGTGSIASSASSTPRGFPTPAGFNAAVSSTTSLPVYSSTETRVKFPTFTPKRKHFPLFKTKVFGGLARAGCQNLIKWMKEGNEVPKMSEVLDLSTDEGILKSKVRDENMKAIGMLQECISVKEGRGRSVFRAVTRHQGKEYPSGNFPEAWKALESRFETRENDLGVDHEQRYHDTKMKEGEEPDRFIDRLEEKRNLMSRTIDEKREVGDDLFIKHVLTKLPKEKKDGALGPY